MDRSSRGGSTRVQRGAWGKKHPTPPTAPQSWDKSKNMSAEAYSISHPSGGATTDTSSCRLTSE